jgi:2-dehydro-3-deoxygalactonokinase
MTKPYSILGDWGTSRLRLYRLEEGIIVDKVIGPGIGALSQAPAETLLMVIAPWVAERQPEKITLCGMAGSRNGLHEVPYTECPAGADAWSRDSVLLMLEGIPIQIMAGLSCVRDNGVPDVMRGEETQIFGALTLVPELQNGRQLLALPGTHGKWAMLQDGHVTGFRTFLTGELFALLCQHSTLLRAGENETDEEDGFEVGCTSARLNQSLLGELFYARSAQLRSQKSAGWARAYLSGLIIGHEVREMLSAVSTDLKIALIGESEITGRYLRCLAAYDASVSVLDGEQCVIAGLRTYKDYQ